jgi:hypothetical protein
VADHPAGELSRNRQGFVRGRLGGMELDRDLNRD